MAGNLSLAHESDPKEKAAPAAAIWHNWATDTPDKRSLTAYDHSKPRNQSSRVTACRWWEGTSSQRGFNAC